VVETPNAELKLLPGMTAEMVIQIEKHENVLKVPNAALRFHPKPEYVHPKHLTLLEGLRAENEEEGEDKTAKTAKQDEDADPDPETAAKKEVKKYVWVVDGDLLSPVEITVGINDSHHTEMISGDLKQDQKVVTGIKTAAEAVVSQKSK
jgi:HlyD family secretion protein